MEVQRGEDAESERNSGESSSFSYPTEPSSSTYTQDQHQPPSLPPSSFMNKGTYNTHFWGMKVEYRFGLEVVVEVPLILAQHDFRVRGMVVWSYH
jgi:hypothetical protein